MKHRLSDNYYDNQKQNRKENIYTDTHYYKQNKKIFNKKKKNWQSNKETDTIKDKILILFCFIMFILIMMIIYFSFFTTV